MTKRGGGQTFAPPRRHNEKVMTKEKIRQRIEKLKTQLRGKAADVAVTKSGLLICDKENGVLVIKALRLVRYMFALESKR